MLPGETILSGAEQKCSSCGEYAKWGVYRSMAGYYVGTCCGCGPYSRETSYFDNSEDAEIALDHIRRGLGHSSIRGNEPGLSDLIDLSRFSIIKNQS